MVALLVYPLDGQLHYPRLKYLLEAFCFAEHRLGQFIQKFPPISYYACDPDISVRLLQKTRIDLETLNFRNVLISLVKQNRF